MGNHTLRSTDSADSPSIDCVQNPGQLAQTLTPTLQIITANQTAPTKCAPGEENDPVKGLPGTEGQKWSFYREQGVG